MIDDGEDLDPSIKDMSNLEEGSNPTKNSAIVIGDNVSEDSEQEENEEEESVEGDETPAATTIEVDLAFERKKRKRTSHVWQEFTDVDTSTVACNWCKEKFSHKTGTTTTLIRHLKTCLSRRLNDKKQRRLDTKATKPISCIESFVYDHAKVREAAAHMVLIHELPFNHMEHEMFNIFMRTATPYWQKISRATSKADCISTYEIEKKKLKAFLKTVKRISITTDLWKSGQDIEYMVVTGHYVIGWKLFKRILNFVHVPPPISGVVLSDALYKCFAEWEIEDKVATLTVDNASYNDVGVRILRENFSLKKKLVLGGKMFHVRCTAHIINLLVQDGLKEIHHVIENVRNSVKYLALSEARLVKFSEIAKQLKLTQRKLILDCPTRWNSTYKMLLVALKFQDVFPRYSVRDTSYEHLPSVEDWGKAECVCNFLGVFNEVTMIISGSEYPTSNLFLSEVWRVKEVLNKNMMDGRPYIKAMALKMNEKFEKYWGDCNLLMAIGSVLDPRYKMMLIGYCFKEIYTPSEAIMNVAMVRDAIYELYNEYSLQYTSHHETALANAQKSSQFSSTTGSHGSTVSGRIMYQSYVMQIDSVQPLKSDLDIYLEEGVYKCGGDDSNFDALAWWKVNHLKYRVLSKMACDILSIPITSVASESAFSAGGRVISKHRASLSTSTVQVLMCGSDWARNLRGIKKSNKVASIASIDDGSIEIDLP